MKAPHSTRGIFAVAVLIGFVVLVLTWPVACLSQQPGMADVQLRPGVEIVTCNSIVAIPSPKPGSNGSPNPSASIVASLVAFTLALLWLLRRRTRRPDGDVPSGPP
jgi:MYXO-CTERM domain-containing protein